MKTAYKFFGIAVILFLLILNYPSNAAEVYRNNYVVDAACLCVIAILLAAIPNLDILEPITLITGLYAAMYFITPIYDICTGQYTWFGYSLFPFGVKASLIALVGYVTFYIAYVNTTKKNRKQIRLNLRIRIKDSSIVLFVLTMYVVCFAANAFYLIHSGYNNLTYILTLGLLGDTGENVTRMESIGFISMLSYSLPAVTMLYWEYGKSRFLKFALFVPMLMMQIARGFRFFVIQIAISFFTYYYLKKNTRPKLVQIVIALIAIMIPVILMTMFRNTIRAGTGMDLARISMQSISEAVEKTVWDNFRIYQNFYGMVDAIPERFGYVYGRQIVIGTLVMMVPRVIWPGKISSYGGEPLRSLIGGRIAAGQAYPNIGEYYYAAGVVGVILIMAVYGWWMKKVKGKMATFAGLDRIEFAILLGCSLQLIIRGYTPSNFWYVIFSLVPVWILRMLQKEQI